MEGGIITETSSGGHILQSTEGFGDILCPHGGIQGEYSTVFTIRRIEALGKGKEDCIPGASFLKVITVLCIDLKYAMASSF